MERADNDVALGCTSSQKDDTECSGRFLTAAANETITPRTPSKHLVHDCDKHIVTIPIEDSEGANLDADVLCRDDELHIADVCLDGVFFEWNSRNPARQVHGG
eukprot:CAMPEP_0179217990 /NCGR_PEP_ID=MMETSP0797-20121207/4222_1 /TAXON_ID=47934 /ORGANISM="Dinophysis acuminata, Strain DAEP01" /LENGTH=102 /DNA_ID=CAMNT_0020924283 /DNA_START=222 /DNA_END=526 /DNA_ORIENTATION=+